MHRAAQCLIMLLFLALKPVLACDAHRPRYGTCVRQDNSLQPKQIQQQTPQVRLRFMFHYQPLPNRRLINGAPPPQAPDRLRRKSTTKDDSPPPPQPDTPIRLYSLLFVLFVVHRKLPRFCTIPFATDPVACATLSGVECHSQPHAKHGCLSAMLAGIGILEGWPP
jgi:hypothetical protein